MRLLCLKCIYVMSVYYVQLFYIHIMFKKYQEHVKVIFVRAKNKTKKIVRMKTPRFIL